MLAKVKIICVIWNRIVEVLETIREKLRFCVLTSKYATFIVANVEVGQ